MRTKKYAGIFALILGGILITVVSGCSTSTQIVSQSLDSKDQDLSNIEHNLVFFTVNVESANRGEFYRLQLFRATNTDTGQDYSFPLFGNVFLGSSNVPHEIEGNNLQQTVFLDLPAGNYSVYQLNLVTLHDHLDSDVDDYFVHQPFPELTLDVSSSGAPQYFGDLNLRLIGVETVGDVLRANLRIIPRTSSAADIEQLQARFPALANQEIATGRLQQR